MSQYAKKAKLTNLTIKRKITSTLDIGNDKTAPTLDIGDDKDDKKQQG